MNKIYALYKGDNFLTLGTKQELADYLRVNKRTIDHYASPYYKKLRVKKYSNCYIVIKVGEDKE